MQKKKKKKDFQHSPGLLCLRVPLEDLQHETVSVDDRQPAEGLLQRGPLGGPQPVCADEDGSEVGVGANFLSEGVQDAGAEELGARLGGQADHGGLAGDLWEQKAKLILSKMLQQQ